MTFIRELARTTARVRWTCIAYCLMSSHYHLVLHVEDGVLPVGMHSLNFRYAMAFNDRHRMKGHVFGARYDSRRLGAEAEVVFCYRYVVRNPVEARLCSSPPAWPWSSYPATIGVAPPISFVDAGHVLDCFGETREVAIARLRAFVE
jgi:putative transposase